MTSGKEVGVWEWRHAPIRKMHVGPSVPLGYICIMEVTMEMVERIAHLARLRFDESEKEAIRTDLEKMIGFVDRLRGLDLATTEPLVHTGDGENVWRTDAADPAVPPQQALREAPAHHGPFFSVPKAIHKD
jgi:aspartyl-tRNA(Asn)/glutamyl-tRNA(Gln) amidotransferase subunit C